MLHNAGVGTWDNIPSISFSELFGSVSKQFNILDYVMQGIETVIDWLSIGIKGLLEYGSYVDLPFFFTVGISISAILLSIKILRSIVWCA